MEDGQLVAGGRGGKRRIRGDKIHWVDLESTFYIGERKGRGWGGGVMVRMILVGEKKRRDKTGGGGGVGDGCVCGGGNGGDGGVCGGGGGGDDGNGGNEWW